MQYLTKTMQTMKRIALIAHDNMKPALLEWCETHREQLSRHQLCGTGTTAGLIRERTGLPVYAYHSGPLGGDQEIGAQIAEGKIDIVIFFSDPLSAQPHDPDVKALLRIAQVYDIPFANNRATADFIVNAPFFSGEYTHHVRDYSRK